MFFSSFLIFFNSLLFFFHVSPVFLFTCVSFLFLFFCLRFLFKRYLHSGMSKVTRATVGRDTNKSFRVCEVNLATLKVATKTLTGAVSRTGLSHEER